MNNKNKREKLEEYTGMDDNLDIINKRISQYEKKRSYMVIGGKVLFLMTVFILTFIFFSPLNGNLKKSRNNNDGNINNVEGNDDNKFILRYGAGTLDFLYDFSNKDILNKMTDYIVLIHVDSIDGVDNRNKINGRYVKPYTYGKATILKQFKGNISEKQINFSKLGGRISFDEYIEGDVSPDKLLRLREEAGLGDVPTDDIMIDSRMQGDIFIENDKIYVAFLEHDSAYNQENEYSIMAFQYGLRELKPSDYNNIDSKDIGDLKVKDNVTGEWVKISDVVNFDE